MKNLEVIQTVRLAIFDEADRIFLCRRSLEAKHLAGFWEFPGGRIDAGETIIEAVVREVREETGIILDEDLVIPKPIYNIYEYDRAVNKWFSRDFLLYSCRIAADQKITLTEAIDYVKATGEDVQQKLVDIPHQRAASRILPALVA